MLDTDQKIRSRSSKTVPLLVVAALAGGIGAGAYFYWQDRSARTPAPIILTEEARAYLPSLDLGGVEMSGKENALGQTLVEITGQIANQGDRQIRSIRLNCVFFDINGIELHRALSTIVPARTGLAPGTEQGFRLAFDDIPDGWNQVMPSLYIAEIVFD